MLETAKARLDAYDEEHKRWLVVPVDGDLWQVWRRQWVTEYTQVNTAADSAGQTLSFPTKEEAECVMRVLRDQAAGRYLN